MLSAGGRVKEFGRKAELLVCSLFFFLFFGSLARCCCLAWLVLLWLSLRGRFSCFGCRFCRFEGCRTSGKRADQSFEATTDVLCVARCSAWCQKHDSSFWSDLFLLEDVFSRRFSISWIVSVCFSGRAVRDVFIIVFSSSTGV